MTIKEGNSQTTARCADCGAPATRRSADGVPLCDGDYEHLVEHWNREFGESDDAE